MAKEVGHPTMDFPPLEDGMHSLQHFAMGLLGREQMGTRTKALHAWIAGGSGIDKFMPADEVAAAALATPSLAPEDREMLEEFVSMRAVDLKALDWETLKPYVKMLLRFLSDMIGCLLLVVCFVSVASAAHHAEPLIGDAAPTIREPIARKPSYADLYAQAVRESRPLIVWVGYKCPSSANQVPGMLHHHAADDPWRYDGDPPARKADGPAVLVLVPRDGALWRAATISAEECCAASIRKAVETQLAKWEGEEQEDTSRSAMQPMMSSGGWSSMSGGKSMMMGGSKGMMARGPMMGRRGGGSGIFSHIRGWSQSRDGNCSS